MAKVVNWVRLQELWKEGRNVKAVAEAMGVKQYIVANWLQAGRKLGMDLPYRRRPKGPDKMTRYHTDEEYRGQQKARARKWNKEHPEANRKHVEDYKKRKRELMMYYGI